MVQEEVVVVVVLVRRHRRAVGTTVRRAVDNEVPGAVEEELELELELITNPYDTEANSAGRRGRACVAQSDGRRGGGRVQRPVDALAQVCVSGP